MKETLKVAGVEKEMKAQVMPFDTSLWAYVHRAAKMHYGHMSEEERAAEQSLQHLKKTVGHLSTRPSRSLLHHTFMRHKDLQARESEVAPTKMLSRHIKMFSLNPSVYGNVYSPLGTS